MERGVRIFLASTHLAFSPYSPLVLFVWCHLEAVPDSTLISWASTLKSQRLLELKSSMMVCHIWSFRSLLHSWKAGMSGALSFSWCSFPTLAPYIFQDSSRLSVWKCSFSCSFCFPYIVLSLPLPQFFLVRKQVGWFKGKWLWFLTRTYF